MEIDGLERGRDDAAGGSTAEPGKIMIERVWERRCGSVEVGIITKEVGGCIFLVMVGGAAGRERWFGFGFGNEVLEEGDVCLDGFAIASVSQIFGTKI